MIPAWSYEEVHERLLHAFKWRYPHNGEQERSSSLVRMVGILFAPPETTLSREEIIPGLETFHHRSGNNIDFFCAGYRRYGPGLSPDERQVDRSDPPWIFSARAFMNLEKEIERLSSWRHSGETDLLLMNATADHEITAVSLDFESAIVCDLEEMKRDGSIQTLRRFFEGIFRFAEESSAGDPVSGFSDQQGLHLAKKTLVRVVLSLLPKRLGEDYRCATHFAIRDIRPKKSHTGQ